MTAVEQNNSIVGFNIPGQSERLARRGGKGHLGELIKQIELVGHVSLPSFVYGY